MIVLKERFDDYIKQHFNHGMTSKLLVALNEVSSVNMIVLSYRNEVQNFRDLTMDRIVPIITVHVKSEEEKWPCLVKVMEKFTHLTSICLCT